MSYLSADGAAPVRGQRGGLTAGRTSGRCTSSSRSGRVFGSLPGDGVSRASNAGGIWGSRVLEGRDATSCGLSLTSCVQRLSSKSSVASPNIVGMCMCESSDAQWSCVTWRLWCRQRRDVYRSRLAAALPRVRLCMNCTMHAMHLPRHIRPPRQPRTMHLYCFPLAHSSLASFLPTPRFLCIVRTSPNPPSSRLPLHSPTVTCPGPISRTRGGQPGMIHAPGG